jgi:hypothetical protein
MEKKKKKKNGGKIFQLHFSPILNNFPHFHLFDVFFGTLLGFVRIYTVIVRYIQFIITHN